MRMMCHLCGMSLRDKITSVMLRERMGVEAIGLVVKRNRLRWFGHLERKDDCDWVKGCTVLEVEGPKPRGRPKKAWMELVKRDMKEMGLRWEDVLDRVADWREDSPATEPAALNNFATAAISSIVTLP